MYSESGDVPLYKVLTSLSQIEEGKKSSLDYKKASSDELFDYFSKILPEYDRNRIHTSDIKKLIQWYNILVGSGITDFEKELAPTSGDNVADREETEEKIS